MHAEIYTDGVDEITVGGAIVRVDLVSLSPTERDANNAPKKVFCQRLIFSIEAFANSVEVMQNALQGLVDAGVVKRNPADSTGRYANDQLGRRAQCPDNSEQSTVPECLNKLPLTRNWAATAPQSLQPIRRILHGPNRRPRSNVSRGSRRIMALTCRLNA